MISEVPFFADVLRPMSYVASVDSTPYVQIVTPFGNKTGAITLKSGNFFMLTNLRCVTNYDNVATPTGSALAPNSILSRPFTPGNFTVQITRSNDTAFSNVPIPQSMIGSSGYRGGKIIPNPIIYGERANFNFYFTDLTGLFLLTATAEGVAVPLTIEFWMEGYDIPKDTWDKFCATSPSFANIYKDSP